MKLLKDLEEDYPNISCANEVEYKKYFEICSVEKISILIEEHVKVYKKSVDQFHLMIL